MGTLRSVFLRRMAWWVGALAMTGFALLTFAGQLDGQEAGTAVKVTIVQNENDASGDPVTFARDVAPLLQQNCQICHRPGSVGPMSLMTYEEVRPWAEVIKLRVQEREMPPYHYDTDVGIQALKGDRRLSEEAIRTIVRWVDVGAPLGDPADLPPPMTFPEPGEWKLAAGFGPPDVVIASTPYDVPAEGQDIWWRPLVETGFTEDRCIRAMEVKPSAQGYGAAHHANPYWRLRKPDGTLEEQNSGEITEYALGKVGEIVPDDACRVAHAGAMVSWDIHYYPTGEGVEDDVLELGIWLHPKEEPQPKYPQTLKAYTLQGGIDAIPPHGTVMTQGYHTFDSPVRIDSFQPHGHLRLRAMSLEIVHPDPDGSNAFGPGSRREMVSMVSNWNPRWHLSHIYEEDAAPLVPEGAMMVVTGWYDNTAENIHNPDPDQWVYRGSRTTDEMSHAWIAVTHLDQEGYERLVAERAGEQNGKLAEVDPRGR